MGSMAQSSILIPSYVQNTELSPLHACNVISEPNRSALRNLCRRGVSVKSHRPAKPTYSSRGGHVRSALDESQIRPLQPKTVNGDTLSAGEKLFLAREAQSYKSESPIEQVTGNVTAYSGPNSVHVHETNFTNSLRDVSYVDEQRTVRNAAEISAESDQDDDTGNGPLEIRKFLKGKNILITGSTGFLGKVLVEKILRVQPDVKQLYLIIQPRAGVAPEQRLESQIIEAELFKLLRAEYGDKYEEFMRSKLTAVGGNVTSGTDLGIAPEVRATIAPEIDLIVHSAANTVLDERYDVAIRDNALGPVNMMEFAKTCQNLKLFLHVSTAFANGNRREFGSVNEKQFEMGQTVNMRELMDQSDLPKLDIDFERKLANEAAELFADANTDEEMRQLGLRRARMFGWQNVYTFSKAMGEMLLFEARGDVPVAVVRPSIATGTYKEPFPGWIQGIRMIDPLAIPYGRGQISGFPGAENTVVDLIPVDLVVNTILTVATKHYGHEQRKTFVYHSSSGSLKPLTMRGLLDGFQQHFKAYPMVDKRGNAIPVEKYEILESEDVFAQYLWENNKLPALMTKLEEGSKSDKAFQRECTLLQRSFDSFLALSRLYAPYCHHRARYENHNTEAVRGQICEEDQETFGYSISELEWDDLLVEAHLPGLRRYVLKGRGIKGLKEQHLD